MKIIEAIQGSPEWHANRMSCNNASELKVAMGLVNRPYRTDLIKAIETGDPIKYSQWVEENIFPNGHRFEALARPLAEKIVGEDLFPVSVSDVVDGLSRPIAASLDGTTMDESTNWEHKSLNSELIAALDAGIIPDEYHPQMEQGMFINGATRCLFMASKWDDNDQLLDYKYWWYESRPELREKIIAAWKQVEIDVANYQHIEVIPAAVAAPVKELPVLFVQARGEITSTNMPAFRAQVTEFLDGLNMKPTTDQEFADAKEIAKKLRECAVSIKAKKTDMLAQTVTIGEVAAEIDHLAAMTNTAALALEKAVTAEEENRKGRLIAQGKQDLAEHIAALNKRIGMQIPHISADFAAAIKGKRLLAAMQNGINTELARAKIEASAIADKIEANLKMLAEHDDHGFLFSDRDRIVLKDAEDLSILIKSRIAEHVAAEQKKADELREKIRAEEEAKAAAKVKAEQEATAREQREAAELAAKTKAEQTNTSAAPVASTPAANEGTMGTPAHGQRETHLDDLATMKLGDISARLGFQVTAEFLGSLGYQPVRIDKNARLYRQSDFQPICDALIRHIQQVAGAELLEPA